MSIELAVTCRACGREWTPDHADYVRGRWRVCRTCRDADPENELPALSGDSEASKRRGERR